MKGLSPLHVDPNASISTSSFLRGTPVWKLIPPSHLKLKNTCVTLQYGDQLLILALLTQHFNYLFAILHVLQYFCIPPTDLNLMRG
jgi:hypothetical protein